MASGLILPMRVTLIRSTQTINLNRSPQECGYVNATNPRILLPLHTVTSNGFTSFTATESGLNHPKYTSTEYFFPNIERSEDLMKDDRAYLEHIID